MDEERIKAQKEIKALGEQLTNFLCTGNRKDDSWKTEGFKFNKEESCKNG